LLGNYLNHNLGSASS